MSTETRRGNEWVERAACRTADPEVFFPQHTPGPRGRPRTSPAEAARRICRACPVKAACLQWALDRPEQHGVWGGTTPEQRTSIRAGRLTVAAALAIPTRAGARRRTITCVGCGEQRTHAARGMCDRCYRDWRIGTGRLQVRVTPASVRATRRSVARTARYLELRHQGVSLRSAADAVGVTYRTAYRYEQQLRDLQGASS